MTNREIEVKVLKQIKSKVLGKPNSDYRSLVLTVIDEQLSK